MSAELYHHGILGMKWGVRRTPEQLGHRKKATAKKSSPAPSKPAQQTTVKKKSSSFARSPHEMSDDDLRRAINRLQLEKQYKDLTRQEVSAGKKWVMSVLSESTKKTATAYLSKAMTNMLDSVFEQQSSKKDKK